MDEPRPHQPPGSQTNASDAIDEGVKESFAASDR
jgi:hypothetical protein